MTQIVCSALCKHSDNGVCTRDGIVLDKLTQICLSYQPKEGVIIESNDRDNTEPRQT